MAGVKILPWMSQRKLFVATGISVFAFEVFIGGRRDLLGNRSRVLVPIPSTSRLVLIAGLRISRYNVQRQASLNHVASGKRRPNMREETECKEDSHIRPRLACC